MITTKNLNLSPVDEADIDIYSQILGSDELTKYLPKGAAYTEQEIRLHIHNRVEHWKHGFGSYVISLKSKPTQKVGYVGVEHCENPSYSDIRYALLANYQGCGFVQEAATAVLAKTFRANLHSKIYGVALKDNRPSLTVLKNLGMKREHGLDLYANTAGLETYSIENFV